MPANTWKSLLADPLIKLFNRQSRGVAETFVGTAGTIRKADGTLTATDGFSAYGFHRLAAIRAEDFVPDREVVFRPSQVVSARHRAGQRFKEPVLVIDYPVDDSTHMRQWASGKYLHKKDPSGRYSPDKDHGYSIVRPDDVELRTPSRGGGELDGASSVRRGSADNTFVRSRSLSEPVNTATAQASDSTPSRQHLLTVKTRWWKSETVAVDDETLLKIQKADQQLTRAARENGGPVVLLPDKSFPTSADEHIENLRTNIGGPAVYVPTGDVSTTIGDPQSLPFAVTDRVVPRQIGIEVHKVDDSPAWRGMGAKPESPEWWANP
ncbi:hypothetical protein ABZV91_06750 [Nocardia sp. NPDC004568]|uniref:hypothetical protein n=1 Tax=Nocardia sp. NPDC004568 TaxID=3154551 RepID=UPI0033B79D1F